MPDPVVMIISAPSGAGKTSLARALVAARNDSVLAVSHTTRAMRDGENDGVDYFFVSPEKFNQMVSDDRFVEHATVFGNQYGTSIDAVESQLSHANNVILDIDWQGARNVRDKFPQATSVFVMPPSIEALELRLRSRNTDSDSVIAKRMLAAMNEIEHRNEYEHEIINDNFDDALAELDTILQHRITLQNRFNQN